MTVGELRKIIANLDDSEEIVLADANNLYGVKDAIVIDKLADNKANLRKLLHNEIVRRFGRK